MHCMILADISMENCPKDTDGLYNKTKNMKTNEMEQIMEMH